MNLVSYSMHDALKSEIDERKDEMMRQGLGADSIAIEGRSFNDPLVPTGPGVREPKNRRAVIDLGG